jgi:hypothetical protein
MGAKEWANLNIWILIYWGAAMINGSFDVYLEGPQGGIWFWSIIGFGIVVAEVESRSIPRLPQDGDGTKNPSLGLGNAVHPYPNATSGR